MTLTNIKEGIKSLANMLPSMLDKTMDAAIDIESNPALPEQVIKQKSELLSMLIAQQGDVVNGIIRLHNCISHKVDEAVCEKYIQNVNEAYKSETPQIPEVEVQPGNVHPAYSYSGASDVKQIIDEGLKNYPYTK